MTLSRRHNLWVIYLLLSACMRRKVLRTELISISAITPSRQAQGEQQVNWVYADISISNYSVATKWGDRLSCASNRNNGCIALHGNTWRSRNCGPTIACRSCNVSLFFATLGPLQWVKTDRMNWDPHVSILSQENVHMISSTVGQIATTPDRRQQHATSHTCQWEVVYLML